MERNPREDHHQNMRPSHNSFEFALSWQRMHSYCGKYSNYCYGFFHFYDTMVCNDSIVFIRQLSKNPASRKQFPRTAPLLCLLRQGGVLCFGLPRAFTLFTKHHPSPSFAVTYDDASYSTSTSRMFYGKNNSNHDNLLLLLLATFCIMFYFRPTFNV